MVSVVLGVTFQQRTWCYLCPIGTMANWVGKNRRPLTLTAERFLECHLCAKQCPMQLRPAALKDQAVMDYRGDCLKCCLCVNSCPAAALAGAAYYPPQHRRLIPANDGPGSGPGLLSGSGPGGGERAPGYRRKGPGARPSNHAPPRPGVANLSGRFPG